MRKTMLCMGMLAMLVLLGLAGLAEGSAQQLPAQATAVQSITLETTSAWGAYEDMTTHRILLLPDAGEVRREEELNHSGEIRGRETFSVDEAVLAALIEQYVPDLFVLPVVSDEEIMDGYYMYLTVYFHGDYAVTFGGHMADIKGPAGFRAMCEAINALVDGLSD